MHGAIPVWPRAVAAAPIDLARAFNPLSSQQLHQRRKHANLGEHERDDPHQEDIAVTLDRGRDFDTEVLEGRGDEPRPRPLVRRAGERFLEFDDGAHGSVPPGKVSGNAREFSPDPRLKPWTPGARSRQLYRAAAADLGPFGL
jgi:hypothetical protein